MYTQCSHCQAVFRVTTAELTSSDGRVRCGECQQVFNGLESLSVLPPEPAANAKPRTRAPAAEISMPPVPAVHDDATAAQPDETAPAAGPAADPAVLREAAPSGPPPSRVTPLPEPAQMETSAPAAPESPLPSATLPRALHEASHAAPAHGASHLLGTLALGLLSFLLIGLLAAQAIYHERHRLVAYPELEPALQWLCRHLSCDLPPRRAPEAFQLSSRNIYSHPNIPDALMVQATLVNQATFAQPYPLVELSFRNLQGELLAVRRFLPEEYLQGLARNTQIAPHQDFHLRLEIEDPGPRAVAYEFRFL